MADAPQRLESLDRIAGSYAAILCDVWGVLHNGARAFPAAAAALARAKSAGKAVVLITNAPRRAGEVAVHLAQLGVPDHAWDRLVTSGEVTRVLIAEGPRRIYHLGPDSDLGLYEGLDVELVEEFEASTVVCTGLADEAGPQAYAETLARLRARDLPFVCANPDIVVEQGDRLTWCAGALARDYAQLGGRTLIAGKPHPPIYRAALAAAAEVLGREVTAGQALAIGDGVLTDVKGAADNGIDAVFVSSGIHAAEYGAAHGPDPALLSAFLARHGLMPAATMPFLA